MSELPSKNTYSTISDKLIQIGTVIVNINMIQSVTLSHCGGLYRIQVRLLNGAIYTINFNYKEDRDKAFNKISNDLK